jgi:hypothetical protein
MTRTLLRTTALALAAAALAAPTALARPDAPRPVATAAVPALHKGLHKAATRRFATRPVLDRNPADRSLAQPVQPSSPPVTVSVASADKGIDWTTIGIGIGGSLIAVGALALITDRTRHPRARIPA